MICNITPWANLFFVLLLKLHYMSKFLFSELSFLHSWLIFFLFSVLFHCQGIKSGFVSILSTFIAFYFEKLMFNLVSVLVLSLLNVLWRVLKLQTSYVQEMHGRYDKQFEYWCHWRPWKQIEEKQMSHIRVYDKDKNEVCNGF